MLKTARGVSGGANVGANMRANGWTNVARTSERGRRAGGRADGRTIRLVLFCLVIISTVNLCRNYCTPTIQPKNKVQSCWYSKPVQFWGRAHPLEGAWRGRTKGSHIRMYARTFMCMYARTFTCMFRNKVTFKVTFYIKGNLISVRP